MKYLRSEFVRKPVRAEKCCLEYVPAIDSQIDLSHHAKVGRDKVVVGKRQDLAVLKAHEVTAHADRPRQRRGLPA